MKFNTDTVLVTREGDEITEPVAGEDPKKITHGIVAVRAIDAQFPEDKDLKPEDVRKRFFLGAKIMAGGLVDLTNEEAALIQNRLTVFGPIVGGQVIVALDKSAE